MKIPDKFPADSKPKRPLRSGLSGRGIGFQPMILSSTKRGMGFQPMIPKSIAGMIRQAALPGLALLALATAAVAGDILRGGATADPSRRNAAARANAGAEAAASAKRTAEDRLARTTKVIESLRSPNVASGSSNIPNGLVAGGLVVANPSAWVGAQLPTQNAGIVTVVQTEQTARLFWESFNIGRTTTLRFDQSAGGTDIGKWIAFNHIVGNGQSRIAGTLIAPGQAYVENPNGITFESGSRISARTFVATTLPINTNLINQGLLNNRDAQFLFSGLEVPGGSDGTPAFVPPPPPSGGRFGDISVQAGALLQGPLTEDGNGGRLMLVGANVINDGVLSTPAGQSILAAGLQVGVQAHSQNDPSLRGLDVWVGAVGDYAGKVTNRGLIESRTGSITVVGRSIEQLGALESSTSVSLNGRIDLLASYGATANPNFDNQGSGGFAGPIFLNQFTGIVRLGPGSSARILPDLDGRRIPGVSLPQQSSFSARGLAIVLDDNATVLVPGGRIAMDAGTWPYVDIANNRTIFTATGAVESNLAFNYSGSVQRFLYDKGQVYFSRGSLVDASGTTGAFVPLSQHILEVQLRGTELADSPLLRESSLRGINLTVDIRRSGVYGGREWFGTPLGDLSGLLNIIERDVAQLTARGGSVSVQAGDSVVIAAGAVVDVSGGFYEHEGGRIQTTRLIRGGRHLIDVEDATPDVLYDRVYDGQSVKRSEKWGLEKTFQHALAPLGAYTQRSYIEGAAGGILELTAPTLLLAGEMRGATVRGPRQLDTDPQFSTLRLTFQNQKILTIAGARQVFAQSPFAPSLSFARGPTTANVPTFSLVGEEPAPVANSLRNQFVLGTDVFEEDGFGTVALINSEGDAVIPRGVSLPIQAGGSLALSGTNIAIRESIFAPGAALTFTAYNFPPLLLAELQATGAFANQPAPLPLPGKGVISLDEGLTVSVAGKLVDDRLTSPNAWIRDRSINGGDVRFTAYSILLGKGTLVDASGGARAAATGEFSYGDGGAISLLAGQDPTLPTTLNGRLALEGTLQAYSARQGGSLSLKAMRFQIGGSNTDPLTMVLDPEFFNQGGFTNYSLTGIGGRNQDGTYLPAVRVVAGTLVEPRATSWILSPYGGPSGTLAFRPFLKPMGLRSATSLSLSGVGANDPFVPPSDEDFVEAIGLVVLEEGAAIRTDPGASLSLSGDSVAVLGTLEAPGGTITLKGRSSFRLTTVLANSATLALPTVYIGPRAVLNARGTGVLLPDPYGRRSGILYPGGTITVAGNIVAEAGALLDVSGASEVFDFHPSRIGGISTPLVSARRGLNSKPWGQLGVPLRVDSDGGTISLEGSEFLYSDATLLGRAGGPSALGGTLAVSSARFYVADSPRTGADSNLIVEQSGSASAFGFTSNFGDVLALMRGATNPSVIFAAGSPNPGIGYFAVDQFSRGGFDNLDLGYYYREGASPISFGGNVEFRGPVIINARGSVRLAGGGVIRANAPVNVNAAYLAVGQEFRAPLAPGDPDQPFLQFTGIETIPYFFPPTSGGGSLSLRASLIDVGTLSLQGIGQALIAADGGDIRGSGSLQVAGDLTMRAAQVYPTTLANFQIFAYDPPGGKGRVSILQSGSAPAPLSAGGSLSLFASEIFHSGTLRAPFGSIRIGWDGTDDNPITPALDSPFNRIAGGTTPTPTASILNLASGSLTSVSGSGLLVPFGISPDGLTWIDPRGVNITTSGLPAKSVRISGDNVVVQSGAVVDLSGGGDLFAYRWSQGTGGSTNLLGSAANSWSNIESYAAGDLVLFGGKTWSARVSINPSDFATPPSPEPSRYWSLVPESYALVPGYTTRFAPYNVFNTGINAGQLQGNPGYRDGGLRIGERIFLEESPGLASGFYTLLPRGYGILPGSFLVVPQEGQLVGSYLPLSTTTPALGSKQYPNGTSRREEGSFFVSGYSDNAFNQSTVRPRILSRFELVTPTVLEGRASYTRYYASSFISDAARRLGLDTVQRLPVDAGSLAIHGNTGLQINGLVRTGPAAGGRGSSVDISSFEKIVILGEGGTPPGGTAVVLNPGLLSSWGAESLLVGGLRSQTPSGTSVQVRTRDLTLDSPNTPFTGVDIALVASERLTISEGTQLAAKGRFTQTDGDFLISGDGLAVRVSADSGAGIVRSGITGSNVPLLSIGSGVRIAGAAVIVDSTYASDLDPSVILNAEALTLASGQISIVLEPQIGALPGTVVFPHLVLEGLLAQQAQAADRLRLSSYRTIDIYGDGTFGSPSIESLILESAGLRGFDRGPNGANLSAGNLSLANPLNLASLAPPADGISGSLSLLANTVQLGTNTFAVQGYELLGGQVPGGILATATGRLTTVKDLSIATSLFSASQGATYSVEALGTLALADLAGTPVFVPGLGATVDFKGSSVTLGADILLPSGSLTATASGGAVSVFGEINVAGQAIELYDQMRFADAGAISIISETGDVELGPNSKLNVAGAANGGRAGTINIRAAGTFLPGGTLLGSGVQRAGSFILNVGSLPSLDTTALLLAAGGFTEKVSIRSRTGSLTLSQTLKANEISLIVDAGSFTLTGTLDASGTTGGSVSVATRNDLTVASTGRITVRGQDFRSSGRGGEVRLEAGTVNSSGVPNPAAFLTLSAGSQIDLGVDAFVPGSISTPGSSAFGGEVEGTLHLRAPRVGPGQSIANPLLANSVNINPILASIGGNAYTVLAEGFWVYDRTGFAGVNVNNALRSDINNHSIAFMTNEASIRTSLLAGNANPLALGTALVLTPGSEIIHRTGDLVLGSAGGATGVNPNEAWDLSGFRYGSEGSPGVLTMRAFGNLVFQNSLSDGFAGLSGQQSSSAPLPGQLLWLANLMEVNPLLPLAAQSWSYRLTSGADLSSSDFRAVRPVSILGANSGSVLVGNYYAANLGTGTTGTEGTTAVAISPGFGTTTRYQVVRTGTGDITVTAGRDVQLRNQFATIYTAGVRIPNANSLYSPGDFSIPTVERFGAQHPDQGDLGTPQQVYPAQWAMAGGNVRVSAGVDIRRVTLTGGSVVTDTSRQLPNNWLYRRGFLDTNTGDFGQGGIVAGFATVNDPSASTTWWIDYSNFFQGVGALGGGDVKFDAGRDVLNVDALVPTNARMAGLDGGLPIAPDSSNLRETGGGDLVVRAGRNIDGGVYYVERGNGLLFAGGQITTNDLRSPSLRGINNAAAQNRDPLTWMATTLFLGKGGFDVSARGDVLIGQVANPFWLPIGINNKFWNKSYFQTYGAASSVDVLSLGGDVTHRLAVVLPGTSVPRGAIQAYLDTQQIVAGSGFNNRAANFQPWIRIGETSTTSFATAFAVAPPILRSTSLVADVNVVGNLNLFPSPSGTLEIVAAGAVLGMNPAGNTTPVAAAQQIKGWISSRINVSDANPATLPGALNPFGYQTVAGRTAALGLTQAGFLSTVNNTFAETGSFTGTAAAANVQRALHDASILHRASTEPVRIFAGTGDVTGFTLFTPKFANVFAGRDVTDVAFYIQNANSSDISIVSAGRDIIPYNENAERRALATNSALNNTLLDPLQSTVLQTASGGALQTRVIAGDIQISGGGILEVLAGRNLDLGTGPNFLDGTGVGITSIGNARNPFLPFFGAEIIALAGVPGRDGGAAVGLLGSVLNLEGFEGEASELGDTPEHEAVAALAEFFDILKGSAAEFSTTGDYGSAFAAISEVFADAGEGGEIFTRARDIRTTRRGGVTLVAPGGGLTMASSIFGNPLTPPGIVTEYGGPISIFTKGDVDIGQARIFTLRGGDLTIWSSEGDIAAGTAPKTVVTAPPTRVLIDTTSADVQTDLGGLATGGGIGVLASVSGVEPGSVTLLAPQGTVDAGDAGIRATGDITIAAAAVLNADNISAGGTSTGVPSAPTVAAPNIGGLSSAASSTGATTAAADNVAQQARPTPTPEDETPSVVEVTVLGYGGSSEGMDDSGSPTPP